MAVVYIDQRYLKRVKEIGSKNKVQVISMQQGDMTGELVITINDLDELSRFTKLLDDAKIRYRVVGSKHSTTLKTPMVKLAGIDYPTDKSKTPSTDKLITRDQAEKSMSREVAKRKRSNDLVFFTHKLWHEFTNHLLAQRKTYEDPHLYMTDQGVYTSLELVYKYGGLPSMWTVTMDKQKSIYIASSLLESKATQCDLLQSIIDGIVVPEDMEVTEALTIINRMDTRKKLQVLQQLLEDNDGR